MKNITGAGPSLRSRHSQQITNPSTLSGIKSSSKYGEKKKQFLFINKKHSCFTIISIFFYDKHTRSNQESSFYDKSVYDDFDTSAPYADTQNVTTKYIAL